MSTRLFEVPPQLVFPLGGKSLAIADLYKAAYKYIEICEGTLDRNTPILSTLKVRRLEHSNLEISNSNLVMEGEKGTYTFDTKGSDVALIIIDHIGNPIAAFVGAGKELVTKEVFDFFQRH